MTSHAEQTYEMTFVVPNAPQAIIVENHYQTLGVATLAATLAQRGIRTCIVDAYLQNFSPEQTADAIRRALPSRVLGFYVPAESTLEHTLRTLLLVQHELGDRQIVLGGPFATMASQQILEKFPIIDAVIRGEADQALVEWLDAGPRRSRWHGLQNLAFIDDTGRYRQIDMRPPMARLDDVPFADREQTYALLQERGGTLSMVASRGCYAPCTYCVVQAFWALGGGPKWRGYSPRRAVDELEHICKHYGPRTIAFQDDNFFGPGKAGGARVRAFAAELATRKLDVHFSIFCRADNVASHPDAIRALRDVGLTEVFIGMEAGAARTLQIYRKNASAQNNLEALAILRDLGVGAFLGAVFLHPWATMAEVFENLAFWKRVLDQNPNIATVIFGSVDVLHGTPMQTQLERENLLTGEILRGRTARFVHRDIALLDRVWQKTKETLLFPAYLDAVRGRSRTHLHDYALRFCRVQIVLLQALSETIHAGLHDPDELLACMAEHPVISRLGATPTATPDEVDACQSISCL